MTEEDVQRNEDAALGKVVRLQYNVEHTRYALTQIRQQMVQVEAWLGQGRRDIDTDWLNKGVLVAIWDDMDRAQSEYEAACKTANGLGVVIPLPRNV